MISCHGNGSELTGGKFANGALTAAFAQMWNGEASNLIGRQGVEALEADIRASGGRVLAREVQYDVYDANGNRVYFRGHPARGSFDVLAMTKEGTLEGWEAKNGETSRLKAMQKHNFGYVHDGLIRFRSSAVPARLEIAGMWPWQASKALGGTGFFAYNVSNGPIYSSRLHSQLFRVFRVRGNKY